MDVLVLGDDLRPIEIFDDFQSLIWTERYSEWGDFELVAPSGLSSTSTLQKGTVLGLNESYRVMMVETIEEPGDGTIKFTGRSLEALMDARITRPEVINAGNPNGATTRNATPGNHARYWFETSCRTNSSVPADNFSFIQSGNLFTPGTIPEPTDTIDVQFNVMSVYEAVKPICDTYGLGFVIGRNKTAGNARFQVYTGSDRTTWQTILDPVVFSPDLETLEKVSSVQSSANFRNVAYVFSEKGSRIVYAHGADATTSGFDRRVLYVDATDITLVKGAALDAALDIRGAKALAEYRNLTAFDGEVPQAVPYNYGVDYNLGDYVERRDSRGFASKLLVTEQIFVSDLEGDRSYPTLQAMDLVQPGSWSAWSRTGIWNDAVGTWDSL